MVSTTNSLFRIKGVYFQETLLSNTYFLKKNFKKKMLRFVSDKEEIPSPVPGFTLFLPLPSYMLDESFTRP